MNHKRKNAFVNCIKLWERMAERRFKNIPKQSLHSFKNDTLRELGLIGKLQSITYGCPFCNEYIGNEKCPLGDCNTKEEVPCQTDHAYKDFLKSWHDKKYNREAAKEFLQEITNLYEEELQEE